MSDPRSMPPTPLTPAQRLSMRALAPQLLSAAAVLLFSAIILFALNVAALHEEIAAERRANQTIGCLYEVEKRVLGLELTVRGYALSGDKAFLTYFGMERTQLAEALRPLPELTAGIPEQERHLQRVTAAVGARVNSLEQLMRLAQSDPAGLGKVILDPKVRTTMRTARAEIGAMRDDVLAHREALAGALAQKAGRDNFLAVGVLTLSVVLGASGLFLIFFGRPSARRRQQTPAD